MPLSIPVNLYYHTHWDREWYAPFKVYQQRLLGVVDGILNLLETHQLENFTLDGQVVLLEDYLSIYPEQKSRIQSLVEAKRLSIGPWYVMPDEFLVSGESLIRNLQQGITLSKQFGQATGFCGYLPDTFGHSQDVPLILKLFDIETAVVWRGVNPEKSLFWWQGLNPKHKVLGLHLTQGYFQNACHMAANTTELNSELEAFVGPVLEKTVDGQVPIIPVGADHLGVDTRVIENAKQSFKNAESVLLDQYCQTALKTFRDSTQLQTISGELTDCTAQYILPGVYSARTYLKQANRKLEWLLAKFIEPLIFMAKQNGDKTDYQKTLDEMWQLLLLNHPHDSICGCSVDSVHRENELRFEQVEQLASSMLNKLSAKAYLEHGESEFILLINTSTLPYTGVVEATLKMPVEENLAAVLKHTQLVAQEIVLDDTWQFDDTVLPLAHVQLKQQTVLLHVNSLPALGVTKALPEKSVGRLVVIENQLENNYLKFEIDTTGEITVTDKQANTQFKNTLVLHATQEQGDSYNAAKVPGSEVDVAVLQSTEVVLTGPFRASLKLNYQFQYSKQLVDLVVSLDVDSTQFLFEVTWVNQVQDRLIQISFNSIEPVVEVIAEGHFNPVLRTYNPDYDINHFMPAAKFKELKTNTGCIQRWVQWQNQVLITKGLCEYEVRGQQLLLTLHRGFGALSNDTNGVRGSQAGPPLATPEAQCLNRKLKAQFCWLPFDSKKNTHACLYHLADVYYGAVKSIYFPKVQQQRLSQMPSLLPWASHNQNLDVLVGNPELIMTGIQPLENNQWLMRVSNPSDQPQKLNVENLKQMATSIQLANALGQSVQAIQRESLIIEPYDVVNLLLTLPTKGVST